MSTNEIMIPERVNFFDGQKVTESDLDTEQSANRANLANYIKISGSTGVVKKFPIGEQTLLNTSLPGSFGENETELVITNGSFDGRYVRLDRQPTDSIYGSRLVVSVKNGIFGIEDSLKVLIIGSIYNALDDRGELVYEILTFEEASDKVTKNYYKRVFGVIFNNLAGGTGKNYYLSDLEMINNIDINNTYVIIKEAEALEVFPATLVHSQNYYPDLIANNFISNSNDNSLEDIISAALDDTFDISELLLKQDYSNKRALTVDTIIGQKFIARTKTLQSVAIALSVDEGDDSDFSGSILFSLSKLTNLSNFTGSVYPDNPIDFDPEQTALVEVVYTARDLRERGINLSAYPTIVNFDLSTTLLANSLIDPSLEIGAFYCIKIKRIGSFDVSNINIHWGYNLAYQKAEDGISLNLLDMYKIPDTFYTEYDPAEFRFIDNKDKSMWFELHASAVEILDGMAIGEDGFLFSIPKTEKYVGNNDIMRFVRNIELINISGEKNYLILNRIESLTNPIAHPRTSKYIPTRIVDLFDVVVLSQVELDSIIDDSPIILGYVKDKNNRLESDITGGAAEVGIINNDKIILINPSNSLQTRALVGRIFTPDNNCSCDKSYIIDSIVCSNEYALDLNNSKAIESDDVTALLALMGLSKTSIVTQDKILRDSVSYIDFYKSDLNLDGIINGADLLLAEEAISTAPDFNLPLITKVITLNLRNIFTESNNPLILDIDGSFVTSSNTLQFTLSRIEYSRVFRIGDVVEATETVDSGTYKISAILINDLEINLTLLNLDDSAPEFTGTIGRAQIYSGKKCNLFADNLALVTLPWITKSWTISSGVTNFSERSLEVINLKRYCDRNFYSLYEQSCKDLELKCLEESDIAPLVKNNKVIYSDVYLDGSILDSSGAVHHGDWEFQKIEIDLPDGNLSGSINIYESFIKSHNGTAKTIAGYPAAIFSDGTYVGCADSGDVTDLSLNRVKIAHNLSSLYIDSALDGYIVSGETEEIVITDLITDVASITSDIYSPNDFTDLAWTGSTYSAASEYSVEETMLILSTNPGTTITDWATVTPPSAHSTASGDFTIEYYAVRDAWDSTELSIGEVASFLELAFDNGSDGTATCKVGWIQRAGEDPKIYWTGVIYNSTGVELYTFLHELTAPDSEGDSVKFRVRRYNDVVTAYYYFESESAVIVTEEFKMIGSPLDLSPGTGDVEYSFSIYQTNSAGTVTDYSYSVVYSELKVSSNEVRESKLITDDITIGDVSGEHSVAIFTVPINVNSGLEIESATLNFVAAENITITDSILIKPFTKVNVPNLNIQSDLIISPVAENSIIFSDGLSETSGSEISIDITSLMSYFIGRESHIKGSKKAIELSIDSESTESMVISDISITITYLVSSSAVNFKLGTKLDNDTSILTLNCDNLLYNITDETERTKLTINVWLKKAGFKNTDLTISSSELTKLFIS